MDVLKHQMSHDVIVNLAIDIIEMIDFNIMVYLLSSDISKL